MNIDIKNILINKCGTIKEALLKMDKEAKGILLVVDNYEKLIGTLTDGDIRRAILKCEDLSENIERFIHINPVTANIRMNKEEIKDLFIKKAVKQIPIVDDNNDIIDLITINDILINKGKENPVIIMAGGLGERLKDLTKEIPKPMLKIGNDPILEHIINNFKKYGYNKIFISVNYKSEIIENYFQDGYAHGIKIKYLKETKRLGTGGGIKLAQSYIDKPFFVSNGDIFTNVDFEKMMDFHLHNDFHISIGTRRYSLQVPYGVVDTTENNVNGIIEKPEVSYLINAGIYCVNPEIIDLIPDNKYFEMTDLINECIKNNMRVGSYEIKDYWMDIGKINDYYKANEEYKNNNLFK